jgi:hypothetical protein
MKAEPARNLERNTKQVARTLPFSFLARYGKKKEMKKNGKKHEVGKEHEKD